MSASKKSGSFVAVLGNDTLDFDYYGSVEHYDNYVSKRTTCYIDKYSRGASKNAELMDSMHIYIIPLRFLPPASLISSDLSSSGATNRFLSQPSGGKMPCSTAKNARSNWPGPQRFHH